MTISQTTVNQAAKHLQEVTQDAEKVKDPDAIIEAYRKSTQIVPDVFGKNMEPTIEARSIFSTSTALSKYIIKAPIDEVPITQERLNKLHDMAHATPPRTMCLIDMETGDIRGESIEEVHEIVQRYTKNMAQELELQTKKELQPNEPDFGV